MTTVFNEAKVWALHTSTVRAAKRHLTQLRVYSGNEPTFSGLSGWVFEQTIQYCIKRELRVANVRSEITEQVRFGSRAKADLRIGNVAVEIKLSGLFSKTDIAKYRKYKQAANSMGLEYLFVTGGESYQQYRDGIARVLGQENVFFLDTPNEWKRLIARLKRLLKRNG